MKQTFVCFVLVVVLLNHDAVNCTKRKKSKAAAVIVEPKVEANAAIKAKEEVLEIKELPIVSDSIPFGDPSDGAPLFNDADIASMVADHLKQHAKEKSQHPPTPTKATAATQPKAKGPVQNHANPGQHPNHPNAHHSTATPSPPPPIELADISALDGAEPIAPKPQSKSAKKKAKRKKNAAAEIPPPQEEVPIVELAEGGTPQPAPTEEKPTHPPNPSHPTGPTHQPHHPNTTTPPGHHPNAAATQSPHHTAAPAPTTANVPTKKKKKKKGSGQ